MRIAEHRLYRYRLPLARRLAVWGSDAAFRDGQLLMVRSAAGAMGWGDLAPLPGISPESPAEAGAALADALGALRGRELTAPDILDRPPLGCGSAAFALDGALLSCMSAEARLPLRLLFADEAPETVAVNALLDGAPEAMPGAARAAVEAGYRSLKVKVGRRDVMEEAALVNGLRDALGPAIGLRLDANRAWSPTEARIFAAQVSGAGIAYIEEPLRHPAGLRAFPLPVALDETLSDPDWEDHGAVAAVIKPSLQDGIAGTLRLVRRVRARGMRPVISSLFESGVGIRVLAAVAAGIGDPDEAHGLDTLRWFAEDVAEPAPAIRGGRLAAGQDPDSLLILNSSVVRDAGHDPA